MLGQPTSPPTFLQPPLRGQSRDYLCVMLDQTAVEVDLPACSSTMILVCGKKYEFSLGGDAGSLWLFGDAKTVLVGNWLSGFLG